MEQEQLKAGTQRGPVSKTNTWIGEHKVGALAGMNGNINSLSHRNASLELFREYFRVISSPQLHVFRLCDTNGKAHTVRSCKLHTERNKADTTYCVWGDVESTSDHHS